MALCGEEEGGGEVRSSACPYLVHESSVSVTAVGRLRDGTGMRQRQCMLHLHVYVCARRSGQCCYSLSHAANPGLAHVEGAWHDGA